MRGAAVTKDPALAQQDGELVLFWGAYDRAAERWSIESRALGASGWSDVETFVPPGGAATVQRRQPVAVADSVGGLWLFWLELAAGRWTLKYNRRTGGSWQLNPSASFPDDARVLCDVALMFHPGDATQRLWLFWTRQDDAATPGQKRTAVTYRVKAGLDPAASDWSAIRTLPKAAGDDDHDREPCALASAGDGVEVFWSSHRGGRWSIWRSTLNRTTHAWGTAEDLGLPPHVLRAPSAFANGSDTALAFRSSASLRYKSTLYGATETVDSRYSGSLTTDTRDAGLLALRGGFDDVGTYLHDSARSNADWYARDTIGVHVATSLDDQQISRLGQVLREFMPLTDRAVFIKDP